MTQTTPSVLKRELGVAGAVLVGLGSILGTGVFVSLGVAAGVAGPAVVSAVAIAALVALCNALSAAQLAANHPVSGGTYEYGYRYLNPWLGFTAGWLFLLAKSASAATAALGFAGYFLSSLGSGSGLNSGWLVSIALTAVLVLTLVALGGIQRSNWVNLAIVTVTLLSLAAFAIAGLVPFSADGFSRFTPFWPAENSLSALFQATALMFVAYTGYGRITTLGEEVRSPRKTIPQAIVLSLLVTMLVYLTVAIVGVGAVGAPELGKATQAAAPLELAARRFGIPGIAPILALGAIVSMLGVLLNLILGLSRVLLAMGRRGDMPRPVARLNAAGTAPSIATIVIGSAIALLVLVGNVKTTWSFSAFTVLVYYALTNWAALQLAPSERLYPVWISWLGLIACLFLAFWVEQQIWLLGLGLIGLGLVWKTLVGLIGCE